MVQYVETHTYMFHHPLLRQLAGAVIGATIAAGLYGAYTGTAQLIGVDPIDSLTAAVLGEPIARVVEPIGEPAPLPELGIPARPRATPTPPPPAPKQIPAEEEEVDESAPKIMEEPALDEPVMEPLPVAIEEVAPLPLRAAAAEPMMENKATALPNSGTGEWLLLSSALGAAAGWHRRRLAALFA